MYIIELSFLIFITQLIFLYSRTWNIKSISNGNIPQALLSGAIIHLTWLVSIGIGSVSMNSIILNFSLEYIPVVIMSLSGGLLGTYLNMKK